MLVFILLVHARLAISAPGLVEDFSNQTANNQEQNSNRCCGDKSVVDDYCNDPESDPYGGLGCNACGIQNCRVCGIDGFKISSCQGQNMENLLTVEEDPTVVELLTVEDDPTIVELLTVEEDHAVVELLEVEQDQQIVELLEVEDDRTMTHLLTE